MSPYLQDFLSGTILVLIQGLAALPWLYVLDPRRFKATARRPDVVAAIIVGVLPSGPAPSWAGCSDITATRPALTADGWWYGMLLHVQLSIDSVIVVLGLLVLVWPAGRDDRPGHVPRGLSPADVLAAVGRRRLPDVRLDAASRISRSATTTR